MWILLCYCIHIIRFWSKEISTLLFSNLKRLLRSVVQLPSARASWKVIMYWCGAMSTLWETSIQWSSGQKLMGASLILIKVTTKLHIHSILQQLLRKWSHLAIKMSLTYVKYISRHQQRFQKKVTPLQQWMLPTTETNASWQGVFYVSLQFRQFIRLAPPKFIQYLLYISKCHVLYELNVIF